MTWETSVALSILGTGFLFVYISSKIDEEMFEGRLKKFLTFMKAISLFFGLLALTYNSTTALHIFSANNGSINANVSSNIQQGLEGHITLTTWGTYVVIAFFILGVIIMALLEGLDMFRRKRQVREGRIEPPEEPF